MNAGSDNHTINFMKNRRFGVVEIDHLVLEEDTTAATGKVTSTFIPTTHGSCFRGPEYSC
jgi:hypothetical protein